VFSFLDSGAQNWTWDFNRGFRTPVNWEDYFIYTRRWELHSCISAEQGVFWRWDSAHLKLWATVLLCGCLHLICIPVNYFHLNLGLNLGLAKFSLSRMQFNTNKCKIP